MNVLIEKYNTRTWLTLPCSEQEMQNAEEEVHSLSPLDTDVLIVDLHDNVEELNTLIGQHVDLDHLNLLARCMDGLFGGEYDQFRAALHIRGVSDIKTMINLTQEVYNYTIASPDASLTSIGKDHYMNLHGGCMMVEDESKIDFAAIARELIASGKGIESPYGLVFVNDLDPSLFFNGKNMPCYYDRQFVISCFLTKDDNSEHLFLPCNENAIAKAVHRLGASDISECSVEIENFGHGSKFSELIGAMEDYDLYDLNRLTHEVQDFNVSELDKLAALYEYTQVYMDPEPIYALTCLAEHLDSFTFAPDIDNTEDLGMYLIKESGEYTYDPELEDYYLYEQFGEDRFNEQNGLFLESGYVGIKDDIEIADIIDESGPRMGGIS